MLDYIGRTFTAYCIGATIGVLLTPVFMHIHPSYQYPVDFAISAATLGAFLCGNLYLLCFLVYIRGEDKGWDKGIEMMVRIRERANKDFEKFLESRRRTLEAAASVDASSTEH